jgi:hypothetical protein
MVFGDWIYFFINSFTPTAVTAVSSITRFSLTSNGSSGVGI